MCLHPCRLVVCISGVILVFILINWLVSVGGLHMCAGTPMQPLEVVVEVALVVRWYLGDQDPLPTVPVVDAHGMHHGPILLLVPVPSIVPTNLM